MSPAISTEEIARLLTNALPGASVDVQGEGGKFQVQVTSGVFAGLNRVKRQQAIYKVLNEHIQSGAIHAVSMSLQAPEESGSAARPGQG
jgi:acid stress-induced BolA-like protein IbaG/YrbA